MSGAFGALWLCYHALKISEWGREVGGATIGGLCNYCGHKKQQDHSADCMVGNGLKAMRDFLENS